MFRAFQNRSYNRGFTLVELLIVMVIISIVAGIGASNYLTSLKRSHDGKRAADLNNLRSALEMYFLDQSPHQYPTEGCGGCSGSGGWVKVTVDELSPLYPEYVRQFPEDPKSGRVYYYQPISCVSGVCSCYCLSAKMEIEDSGGDPAGACSHYDVGGADYDYTLTCP